MIGESKHFMVFTGAGISTAAGIPDFRGPTGVWTLKAQGKEPQPRTTKNPEPTYTHMCLVELMRRGVLKHLVSQNCDGLHIKSGINPSQISELHGNSNVEACPLCTTVYLRKHRVRNEVGRNDQKLTGRQCDNQDCKGLLRYTTVAFNQSMPDRTLDQAEFHSKQCDVALCMGTSMRVMPACDLPVMGKKRNRHHKLVIVNLQKTPYDDECAVRIFSTVDKVMKLLMLEMFQTSSVTPYAPIPLTDEYLERFKKEWKFRGPESEWNWGRV